MTHARDGAARRRAGRRSGVVLVVLLLVGAVLAARGLGGGGSGTPPAFDNGLTLEAGEARSAAMGQPVLALASAEWCGPCRVFKRGALADDELNRLVAERTVPVYLDVDKDRPGAGRLGVSAIPALVLIREGRVIARLEGARPAGEVRQWLLASTGEQR